MPSSLPDAPLRTSTVGLLAGVLVGSIGLFGLAAPEPFVATVGFFQVPPAIYAAAAMRIALGLALLWSAPASRAPLPIRALGLVITLGGLATPFVGARLGQAIVNRWSAGGSGEVRLWAAIATALGVAIVWAFARRREASSASRPRDRR